ncbi:MAG: TrkH family potassium uptake protein [Bacillota bacterium]|nr:TrkH family potassium uptake protein [Bacillota bacterium]
MKPRRRGLTPARIIILGFLAVIGIGTMLLMLPVSTASGRPAPLLDAMFTATSATCVTGLVSVDTGTYWSAFGKGVILLLIQIGGLGVVTLTTLIAILLGKKVSLQGRLLVQESLNLNVPSGVIRLAIRVAAIALTIEGIGALLLMMRFVPDYGWAEGVGMSIFHAISAFCNAGFDLIGGFRSMTGYVADPLVNLVLAGLIVLGGLGFFVVTDLLNYRKTRKLRLHTKLVLVTTGILLVLPTLLFFVIESGNPATFGPLNWLEKWIAAFFQAVSPRTAGFNTIELGAMYPAALFLTIILMFIGGSPGSTAGGVKTSTVALHVLAIRRLLLGREDIEFGRRRLSREIYDKALAILIISVMVVSGSVFLLSWFEPGLPLSSVIFEVFSALGTVGLSLGLTPQLGVASKLLLMLLMFFGRIGPLTIVLALSRRKMGALYRYPEEQVIIG